MKTNKIYCECGGLMNETNNNIIRCEECNSIMEINIKEDVTLKEGTEQFVS